MKFIPRLYLPPISPGDERNLPRDEAHRLTRVLRLAPGAKLLVFDGEGTEYRARLASAGAGTATVAVGEMVRHEPKPGLAITLVPSISRATRMEWLLEKSVELGAVAIHPVFAARGKVRLDATRAERRLAHWRAVIIAAAAQCGRARLPHLAPPVSLDKVLNEVHAQSRIVLLPEAETPLARLPAPRRSVTSLTGPESGFDEAEKEQIAAAGWQATRLGPLTLRTETAGPAALAAAQSLWGDWQ